MGHPCSSSAEVWLTASPGRSRGRYAFATRSTCVADVVPDVASRVLARVPWKVAGKRECRSTPRDTPAVSASRTRKLGGSGGRGDLGRGMCRFSPRGSLAGRDERILWISRPTRALCTTSVARTLLRASSLRNVRVQGPGGSSLRTFDEGRRASRPIGTGAHARDLARPLVNWHPRMPTGSPLGSPLPAARATRRRHQRGRDGRDRGGDGGRSSASRHAHKDA